MRGFFYGPRIHLSIELSLRRTLVCFVRYSAGLCNTILVEDYTCVYCEDKSRRALRHLTGE